MTALFRWVVTHPVAMSMMFIAAIVFGWVSYAQIPVELMPDISYPRITVRTIYDGAAPEEVEEQVSRRIEESLATLDGLVTLESRSRAGASDVVLSLAWSADIDRATQTIREQLQTTWLPDGAERPLILRYDPSLDPFLRLAIAHTPDHPDAATDAGLFLLREVAEDELKRDLESLPGVAAVRVRGGLERELHVDVHEGWLAARRLTLDQVRSALVAQNVNVAGGSILEGDVEYLVRTLNQFTSVSELQELRIRRADGEVVRLADVATVSETHRDREVLSRLDGAEAVELELFKEADANVVDVANRVKERVFGDPALATLTPEQRKALSLPEPLVATLPDGLVIVPLDDQAAFIQSAIDNLRDTALMGGVFAVLVLFAFLKDFRATAIIGLAIPVSVVVGFAPLYLQGVSLNLMSLGGLALGVGMLVDNGVVVLDSISRYRELGERRVEAAVHGVSAVAAAVVASTLTTVAVFLPIGFVVGIGGQLFGDLSLAVVSSLVASLAVALLLVPTLAALDVLLTSGEPGAPLSERILGAGLWRWSTQEALEQWRGSSRWLLPWSAPRLFLRVTLALFVGSSTLITSWFARGAWRALRLCVRPIVWLLERFADSFQALYRPMERWYARALASILTRPGLVVVAVLIASLLAGWQLPRLGTELIPELHQGRFTVEAALPVGTPLPVTAATMVHAERTAAAHPDVARVYSTVGVDRRTDTRADEGEHTARLRVELQPWARGADDEDRVMEDLRRQLAAPRLNLDLVRPALFSFRTPVEVVLYGHDLDVLRATSDRAVQALEGVPGLRDVRSSLVAGNPEIRVRYDRERAYRFGLDPATAAQRVREKVQGVTPTRIQRGEKRVDLVLRLIEDERGTLQDLAQLNVNPNVVPAIPLDVIADLQEGEGPSEIRHLDQQRAAVISANLEGFDLGRTSDAIRDTLDGLDLPPGVRWELGGQSAELDASTRSLELALLLAIFLVYVIMASTFEHIVHPLVILLSVPLSVVGVALGLTLWGLPVSVVVFIGAIVLAGVVVNNAIVLVDTINQLRDEGTPRLAAIREAARLRLRPILITTATTVLGLAPLSLGFGEGAELQQVLAVTIIGGLTSSTLLTLALIPVLYGAVTGGLREPSQPEPRP